MSTFELNDETSIDVLIFWIASADGSISYTEQATVKRILENMRYGMDTYHKTFSHISSLSTEHVEDLASGAINHIKSTFSEDGKKLVFNLVDSIANCDAEVTDEEQAKLDELKAELGI